jgi:hypothetical protein
MTEMIIARAEFANYVLLPNPHGREQNVSSEKFSMHKRAEGVEITCRLKGSCMLIPWGNVVAVRYEPPAVRTEQGPKGLKVLGGLADKLQRSEP